MVHLIPGLILSRLWIDIFRDGNFLIINQCEPRRTKSSGSKRSALVSLNLATYIGNLTLYLYILGILLKVYSTCLTSLVLY